MKALSNAVAATVAVTALGVIIAGALIAVVTVVAGGGPDCPGRVVLDPVTVTAKAPVYRCEVQR